MRILLVEDDPMIGKTLHAALQQEGYVVDWVKDGQSGRLALDAAEGTYALVLLDLGLPGKSGLELLKELRRAGSKVRVLIVTARDAVTDRVAGLDAGADDYLVKPFSLDELAARMRALLRRDVVRGDNVLRNGDLALDPVARTVTRAGLPIELSNRELALLAALLERPGTSAVQGAARGTPVRLGRRSGKQRGRGARPQSAQEAGRRRDTHDPGRRLRDRAGMTSIRRTLLVRLLLGLAAVAAVATLATYVETRREIGELFDLQLKQLAYSTRIDDLLRGRPPAASPRDGRRIAGVSEIVTQIWDRDGVLVYWSQPGAGLPVPVTEGYSDVVHDGRDVARLYARVR